MKIKKILILTSSLEIIERRNSSKITISLIYVAKLKLKMKIFDELTIVFHVSFQKRYCKQKKKKILYQSTWFFPQNITITLPKCAFSGGLWIFRKRYHQKRLPFNDFPKRRDQILGLFLGIFLKERTRQNLNTRDSSNFSKKYLLQVENIHYKLIIANRWSFQNVIIILPATFFEKITLFLFLPSWNSANQWPFQNVITIWLHGLRIGLPIFLTILLQSLLYNLFTHTILRI